MGIENDQTVECIVTYEVSAKKKGGKKQTIPSVATVS